MLTLFQSALHQLAKRNRIRNYIQNANIRIHTKIEFQRIFKFIENCRPIQTEHPLIRIGADYDGGYVIADDLTALDACFSPGVSTIADFELAMAERGLPCFMIDFSVDAPPIAHPLFHFQKKFLGNETKGDFISLPDWVAACAPQSRDLILQMDIEGAEIAAILGTPSAILRKFRHLIIEFHWLEHLLDPAGLYMFEQVFDKLLADFDVVHCHPNNCLDAVRIGGIEIPQFLEISFLRKDRSKHREALTTSFPHPLDRPNIPAYEDTILHPAWYRSDFIFPKS